MRKGGGHAKGSAAERKVAVMLSKWWYGEKGYLWRKPGNEIRRYEKYPHSGDIVPTHTYYEPKKSLAKSMQWPFHVEVKSWKRGKLKIYSILDKPTMSPVHKIWRKAERKKRKDLKTMLVLKENTHDWLVFMTGHTWQLYFGKKIAYPYIIFEPSVGIYVVGTTWKVMSKLIKRI